MLCIKVFNHTICGYIKQHYIWRASNDRMAVVAKSSADWLLCFLAVCPSGMAKSYFVEFPKKSSAVSPVSVKPSLEMTSQKLQLVFFLQSAVASYHLHNFTQWPQPTSSWPAKQGYPTGCLSKYTVPQRLGVLSKSTTVYLSLYIWYMS